MPSTHKNILKKRTSTAGQPFPCDTTPAETQPDRARHPRAGWEEQCRLMAEHGDDFLPTSVVTNMTSWDENEWEW